MKQEYGNKEATRLVLQNGKLELQDLHAEIVQQQKEIYAPGTQHGGTVPSAGQDTTVLRSKALRARKHARYGKSLRTRIDAGSLSEGQLSGYQWWILNYYDSGDAVREADYCTRQYGFGILRGEQEPSWLPWDEACQWETSLHFQLSRQW